MFLDVLQDNFLLQHVDGLTRDGNILDLLMSNEIAMVDVKRCGRSFRVTVSVADGWSSSSVLLLQSTPDPTHATSGRPGLA